MRQDEFSLQSAINAANFVSQLKQIIVEIIFSRQVSSFQ